MKAENCSLLPNSVSLMKKAYILYKKSDAAKNGVLIDKYFAALKRRAFFPLLILLDGLDGGEVCDLVSDGELVINRSRDAGTARFLEERGLRVSNPSVVNETANDKLLTWERLHSSVPMLDTFPLTDAPALPFPFVAKPAGGHGGNGVSMIRNDAELAAYRAAHPEKSVIQPLASELGRDMRVYVIGGKPVFAMLRESDTDFRSNFSLGDRAIPVPLNELKKDETDIIRSVCSALPLDYAGVDIMRDRGRAVLNEIEDPVGARMLYINTEVDPAEEHVSILTASRSGSSEE